MPSSPVGSCSPIPSCSRELSAARAARDSATRSSRRQLDAAARRVRAPPGTRRPPARDRRARDPRRVGVQQLPGQHRRPPRRRQRDLARSCAPATTPTERRPRGRRRSRSAPRWPTASASWHGSATRPRGRSGSATTSRWRSPRASSTRSVSSPPSTMSTAPTAEPFAAWKHALDERLAARFGCAGRRPPALAPRRPVLPEPARRRRHRTRPPLRRRRSRGAHHPHLRRPRPRHPAGAPAQRSLRTSGQEPARVLHRHRPLRRRARAVQRGAQRAVDGHDAPRVRPCDLRPRVRPRPALAPARRHPCADHRRDRDAHGPAPPRSGVARRRSRPSTRPPPTRSHHGSPPRNERHCWCSRGGCS